VFLTILLVAFALSLFGSWLFARRGGLGYDTPNTRSSHIVATPRGGGVAFVIVAYLIYYGLSLSGVIGPDRQFELGILLPSFLVFLLGVVEDLKGTRILTRFGLEGLIALLPISQGLYWHDVGITPYSLNIAPALGIGLTILWLVWGTNLYNFMDGLNGIAASQGIVLAGTLALILGNYSASNAVLFSTLLLFTLAGFLPINFPKAKMFMGDSGSLFLGFLFAALPLYVQTKASTFSLPLGILLLSPFFFDALITLLIRFFKGEDLAKAHKTHFYQKFQQIYCSHFIPTITYTILGLTSGGAILFYKDIGAWAFASLLPIFAVFYLINLKYESEGLYDRTKRL
jgi:Fuc2NAc and GlcNAc transferase